MTECERLIAEGSLPAGFIQEEMRESLVPVELKKLWALQIDLLRQVERICEKHGLRFFAICGTALGAVRHKGFIPWDDDMDLGLPRADYNAFLQYAQEELGEPYFLQIPTTDPHYYRPFAALRNSSATCIARGDGALPCNNGAIIHIFPLDGFTECKKLRRFIKIEKLRNAVAVNSYHYKGRTNHRAARFVLKLLTPFVLLGSRAAYWKRHERRCTEISRGEHEQIGMQFAHFENTHKVIWEKSWFDSVVWVPFEYHRIPLPVGYEQLLRRCYKAPMELPAPEKRIYRHTWETDADTPYKEYCAGKYGVKYS